MADNIPFVDLRAQHDEVRPEIEAAIKDIIDRSSFIGGAYLQNFERNFASYLGVKHAIGVANGTDALWLGLFAAGVRPGDGVITVPNTLELAKIDTGGGGGVRATGIAGRVDIQSGGGTLHLDDIGGPINAQTGGGTIDVGNVRSDVNIRTGGGNIKVASAKGKLGVETGGGKIVVLSCEQGATLQTGAGDILVQRCQGDVRATTGGGSVDLGERESNI